MTRPFLLLTTLSVLLTGCSASVAPSASSTAPGASGSLGVVTAQAAAEAISAICQMRGSTDRDAANALFFDRAHSTLHALAAAAEPIDRVSTAQVLLTMQRVEADLQADELPASFEGDARALLEATRSALATVDLPAPAC